MVKKCINSSGNCIQYLQFLMTQNPIRHSDGLPPFPGNLPENDKAADKIVDIHSISEQNSPENVTFKKLDNRMELFN